jgi:hypothetical protein
MVPHYYSCYTHCCIFYINFDHCDNTVCIAYLSLILHWYHWFSYTFSVRLYHHRVWYVIRKWDSRFLFPYHYPLKRGSLELQSTPHCNEYVTSLALLSSLIEWLIVYKMQTLFNPLIVAVYGLLLGKGMKYILNNIYEIPTLFWGVRSHWLRITSRWQRQKMQFTDADSIFLTLSTRRDTAVNITLLS